MGVAAYNRGSDKIANDIRNESRIDIIRTLEALEFGKIRREQRDSWRQKAMSFMADSEFFVVVQTKMSTRRGYQTKRNTMLETHALWIDAKNEIELNQRSCEYAQAVFDYILWITKGTSIADNLLSEFR